MSCASSHRLAAVTAPKRRVRPRTSIAFIAGVAFSAVVNSLVTDVIMQLVAAIVGKPDFSALTMTVNGSEIRYGSFLTALLDGLRQPVEGLGHDDSPSSHMWRTMIWPNNLL